MNFTTDLPKRNPLVSYIVASAVRCAKLFPTEPPDKAGPCYRMHAVILKVPPNPANDDNGNKKLLYICCHVRRVETLEEENKTLDQSPLLQKMKLGPKSPKKPSPPQQFSSINLPMFQMEKPYGVQPLTQMASKPDSESPNSQPNGSNSNRPRRTNVRRRSKYDEENFISGSNMSR